MFISIPKDFLLSKYENIRNTSIIKTKSKDEDLSTERYLELEELKEYFSKKFNFSMLKSLNILKNIDLEHVYKYSNAVFEILFYAHEVILNSLNTSDNNYTIPNLSKMLCSHINNNSFSKAKELTKEKSKKLKKEKTQHSPDSMNEELKKSLDQIKFEQKALIIKSLDSIKDLNSSQKKELIVHFIEKSVIPSIKYVCEFINLNKTIIEDDIRNLIL